MPWGPWALVTLVRFVLWPAVAIPAVYVFATKTRVLDEEPMLWFAMMLMPTGPPALSITAMADVSGAGEEQKLSIAKFLTVSAASFFFLFSFLFCSDSVVRSVAYGNLLTDTCAGVLRRLAADLLRGRRRSQSQSSCCADVVIVLLACVCM